MKTQNKKFIESVDLSDYEEGDKKKQYFGIHQTDDPSSKKNDELSIQKSLNKYNSFSSFRNLNNNQSAHNIINTNVNSNHSYHYQNDTQSNEQSYLSTQNGYFKHSKVLSEAQSNKDSLFPNIRPVDQNLTTQEDLYMIFAEFLHSNIYVQLQSVQRGIIKALEVIDYLDHKNQILLKDLQQSKHLIQFYQFSGKQKEKMLELLNRQSKQRIDIPIQQQQDDEIYKEKKQSVHEPQQKVENLTKESSSRRLKFNFLQVDPANSEASTPAKDKKDDIQDQQTDLVGEIPQVPIRDHKERASVIVLPHSIKNLRSRGSSQSIIPGSIEKQFNNGSLEKRNSKIFDYGTINNYERYKFTKHGTEFAIINQILNLNTSEAEIYTLFKENRELHYLWGITKDKPTLKQSLVEMDRNGFEFLFESIVYSVKNLDLYLKGIIQLKKVIKVFKSLNSTFTIEEAFQNIVQVTCNILECERASIFLADYQKRELWTKVAKGANKTIRVPFQSGLVGHVLQSGEVLNILDAHTDIRFNPEIDKKNNFVTKTVLTCPIYNSSGTIIIGVIQAINQQFPINDREKVIFFTQDDEGILSILGTLGQTILNNSMYIDEQLSIQNSLRSLFISGIRLNLCHSVKEFIIQAERQLQHSYDIEQAFLYVFDDQKDTLYRYSDDGQQLEYSSQIGITGQAFQFGQSMDVKSSYQHQDYTQGIDIETNMPIILIPIYSPNIDEQFPSQLGIIAAVNSKGIDQLIYEEDQRESPIQNQTHLRKEVLQNFAQILSQTLYIKYHFNDKIKKATLIGGESNHLIDQDMQ